MGMDRTTTLRLAIQQRVLPDYRGAFFDLLARRCAGGLGIFTGRPKPQEGIVVSASLDVAEYTLTHNYDFMDPSSPFYLCWQGRILDWLGRFQPDVLIVEANPRLLSSRLAVRWMHDHSRPVLGWGLGAPALRGVLSPIRSWERNTFLRALDGWIAYSQRGAREYQALGLDPTRIFTAGNAVAPRPAASPPSRPESLTSPPVILFVGRLQKRKRIDLLLRASANLPPDLQPRLMIVGDGPDRAAMESLARQVYPSAEFVGIKRGLELASFFEAADLFVLPGTGGLAVQQAMANALPVIVAQGDGTQDDLVRPSNGWLVPPDDLPALEAALRQALTAPALLRRKGLESFRIVSEEINLERMADAFLKAVFTVRSQLL